MAKPRIEMELSEADLAEFRRLLATGRLTIDGLTLWLEGRGYAISRSAVGRYAKDFDEVAARLRESREMAEAIVRELGPEATDGRQGRLLVEMLRTLVNEHLMKKLRGEDGGLDPQQFMFLAKALKDAAGAARLDQDFEVKVRTAALKEAADKLGAATAAAKAAGEKGLSEERIQELRRVLAGGAV